MGSRASRRRSWLIVASAAYSSRLNPRKTMRWRRRRPMTSASALEAPPRSGAETPALQEEEEEEEEEEDNDTDDEENDLRNCKFVVTLELRGRSAEDIVTWTEGDGRCEGEEQANEEGEGDEGEGEGKEENEEDRHRACCCCCCIRAEVTAIDSRSHALLCSALL